MKGQFGTFDGEKPPEMSRNITKVALIQSGYCHKYLAGLGKPLVISPGRCTYPF